MNTQHRDILTAIGRKQPITTSGVAEYLMDHFGYGGGMEFDTFRDQVSKTIGYLKSKGDLTGEDRPQPKGKPLRHWSLAESQPEEMASDVAEVESQPVVNESLTTEAVAEECSATGKENLPVETPETFTDVWTHPPAVEFKAIGKENLPVETTTPEPVLVEVKTTTRPRLSAEQLIQGYKEAGAQGNMLVFAAGVAFAEKHHGIG